MVIVILNKDSDFLLIVHIVTLWAHCYNGKSPGLRSHGLAFWDHQQSEPFGPKLLPLIK
jgi:hypothetical protein